VPKDYVPTPFPTQESLYDREREASERGAGRVMRKTKRCKKCHKILPISQTVCDTCQNREMALDTDWFEDLVYTVVTWFQAASTFIAAVGIGFLLLWGLVALIHWMWNNS
jgi:RNA polymerase subunit RPABC4/transcription elongation factor Spt4